MAGDPFWEDVLVLLPFDGTDGQTGSVPDTGPIGHSCSLNSGAALTTTTPKVGTASARNTTYASFQTCLISGSDLILDGLMTIDCWARSTNTPEDLATFLASNEVPRSSNNFGFAYQQSTARVFLGIGNGTTGPNSIGWMECAGLGVLSGNWHHYAVGRDLTAGGGTQEQFYFWMDGDLLSTPVFASGYQQMGKSTANWATHRWNGYSDFWGHKSNWVGDIDMMRITKNLRWTADFTPPATLADYAAPGNNAGLFLAFTPH